MNKKLQVFISSTFKDLIDERQAAVEAILSAGHIPAGMELFKSGSESQLDVIKRWIDESDVYMLILGGRYGSIEPVSGKSYTHVEYEYAVETGKPVFAVVMNQTALDEKVKVMLSEALERENPAKYNEFKAMVQNRMCKFFDDTKDIKIAIHESLRDIEQRYVLSGWVAGKEVPDVNGLNQEIIRLQQENMKLLKENLRLKETNEKLKTQQKGNEDFNGMTYEEVKKLLQKGKVILPADIFHKPYNFSYLDCFEACSNAFATGVTSQGGEKTQTGYMYYYVAPEYLKYGLVEKVKDGKYEKIQTSKAGHRFLALYQKEQAGLSQVDQIAATEE